MLREQQELIEKLRSADAYPHATGSIELVETHISWVLLTGDYAYKIKKAVKLPFLDFSTLERRRRFCDDELELNRRLAPELYLEVVTIGGDASQPRLGAEPAIEYAVCMRQFPSDALADRLVRRDALEAAELVRLAERIADFHRGLEPRIVNSSSAQALENLAELESELGGGPAGELEPVADWLRREASRLEPELTRRIREGRVRECHGDLHLGNIARVAGELLPFDCLEFDAALRTIDVLDEAAFLFMDLLHHGRQDLAFVFLNHYLAKTGDYDGLAVLWFFTAHRALVRAKVETIRAEQHPGTASKDSVAAFIATAATGQRLARPALLITSGLSGSGKTTIARDLAQEIGAIHIRSDIERKRLYELPADARTDSELDSGIYSAAASAATYARLAGVAGQALAAGLSVIVDAAFLSAENRRQFRELARRHDAPFAIVSCEADETTLRARIVERAEHGRDASEADLAVLSRQIETADPFSQDESTALLRVDTRSRHDAGQLAARLRELGVAHAFDD